MVPLGGDPVRLAAALLALVISFPAAWAIRLAVDALPGAVRAVRTYRVGRALLVATWVAVLACLWFVEPRMGGRRLEQAVVVMLAAASAGAWIAGVAAGADESRALRVLRWAAMAAAALRVFVTPPGTGPTVAVAGLAFAALAQALAGRSRPRPIVATSAAAVLVVALFGAEICVRRLAPVEAGEWGELPALERHSTRTYALRSNQTTRLRYNNYDYVVRTNSLGLPMPEVPVERPTPDTLRVLVIGDAFTMPEGLESSSAYPALLEERLTRHLAPRRVQVFNAGVTGYGPAEQVPQLAELAPLLRPDVVVYEFFVNEFDEVDITPEARLANIGFIRIEPILYSSYRRLQSLRVVRRLQDTLSERVTGRPAGWRYSRALLEFYQSGDNKLYGEAKVARLRKRLAAMRDTSSRAGARFMVFYVPAAVAVVKPSDMTYFPWDTDPSDRARFDMERPWRIVSRLGTELGVTTVDLTPPLSFHPRQPVYFPDSWHWNSEGHRVVADAIARSLESAGVFRRGTATAEVAGR
jgi:hypothetical protein